MAKINQLSRFGRIINRLSGLQEYVSAQELLEAMHGIMGECQPYTIRTLQRDINTISEIFGIEIENRRGYGYHITERARHCGIYSGLLSDYEILSFMKETPGIHEYVIPEHRQQVITINIKDVLVSIAHQQVARFNYKAPKYNGQSRQFTVNPYFIKQSQGKWYLFAVCSGEMRSFEMGRFEDYTALGQTFERDRSITLDGCFSESFGIWEDFSQPIEEIILKVSQMEWEYLKTYPIHHSQAVVSAVDGFVTLSIRLRISYDFIMDLMSRCPAIEVVSPSHLRQELAHRLEQGLSLNR